MILFTASDLIWGSRIKRTGESVGLSCRPVRSVAMLEDRLGEGGVTGLVLDLDVMELAESLVARLRGEEASPVERAVRIIAFGPHVRTDLFERIRQAGADEVITRGAFDRTLPDLLLGLATSAPSDQR